MVWSKPNEARFAFGSTAERESIDAKRESGYGEEALPYKEFNEALHTLGEWTDYADRAYECVLYVDNVNGDNDNSGKESTAAYLTLDKALESIPTGAKYCRIVLMQPGGDNITEPVIIQDCTVKIEADPAEPTAFPIISAFESGTDFLFPEITLVNSQLICDCDEFHIRPESTAAYSWTGVPAITLEGCSSVSIKNPKCIPRNATGNCVLAANTVDTISSQAAFPGANVTTASRMYLFSPLSYPSSLYCPEGADDNKFINLGATSVKHRFCFTESDITEFAIAGFDESGTGQASISSSTDSEGDFSNAIKSFFVTKMGIFSNVDNVTASRKLIDSTGNKLRWIQISITGIDALKPINITVGVSQSDGANIDKYTWTISQSGNLPTLLSNIGGL